MYASFNYGDGEREADGWRPGFDYTAQVVTAGVDCRAAEGFFVGGAVNVGRLNADVAGGRGDFTVEDATGRLYGVWRGGPISLALEGDYGTLRVKGIHRRTAFGTFETNAKTSGTHWGAGVKAMWSIDGGGFGVRPWLGLRTERVTLDAFSERDVASLNFDFAEQEAKSTAGAIGVDLGTNWKLGGRDARFDFRAAWHDEIGNKSRRVSGRLGSNFTLPASASVEDGDGSGIELGGAVSCPVGKNWTASLGYAGDIRSGEKLASRFTLALQSGF